MAAYTRRSARQAERYGWLRPARGLTRRLIAAKKREMRARTAPCAATHIVFVPTIRRVVSANGSILSIMMTEGVRE
ncbi:MAG: hypothetical protein J5U17_05990 [Candidatus Methanoperedens sp.]|nr:hypothetical protein [Candidatus Methanoperedens sp.]MCE8428601.1 hypothetical protein [Candidatus Methanoperedens sp.]